MNIACSRAILAFLGSFWRFLGRFGAFWVAFRFFLGRFGPFWRRFGPFWGVLTGCGCVGRGGSAEAKTRGTRVKSASQALETPELARRSGHWAGETPGYGDF